MGRGKELSPQMRSRICELRNNAKFSANRIHKIHPEIPLSTIKTTIKRESQRINNVSRPRSGQPRKLSEDQRDQLYERVESDPHVTHKDLLDSVDNACKKRSLRYLLREMGKRKWLQLKRPQLTDQQAAKRLAWALRYQHLNWRRVKWSDESTVRRGKGARAIYTFTRPRDQLQLHDIAEHRPKPVSQMFWALFGHESRSELIAFDGRVNGLHIRDLYERVLPGLVQPGDIFMHDNAPVHTARIVKALLGELRIEVMEWPPYSPDLNPIENLWALMKEAIHDLYPELRTAPDTVATQLLLVAAAKEAWDKIEQRIHYRLIDTMPHRVAAVIAAEGWYTKY